MEVETLSQVILALIIGTSIGVAMEPFNLRKQLGVLEMLIDGKKQEKTKGPDIKPNIFTAAIIGSFGMGMLSLTAYFEVSVIDPEPKTTLLAGIAVLVFAKTINSMQIDRVHAHISKIKDRYR